MKGGYQQSLSDALHHPALDAGFTQDVVWSDACLTRVDKLPPGDTTAHRPGVLVFSVFERFSV